MKITIVGTGYVGFSLAVLLAKEEKVFALDIDKEKVNLINKKISPFEDKEIEDYLISQKLDLTATINKKIAYENASYIIVATPTNYDNDKGIFDTSSVESVIADAINFNKSATIVIKSTIPMGFTELIKNKFNYNNIFYSPEFLRESKALHDNLYPSRIVVGSKAGSAVKFSKILSKSCKKNAKDIQILFMESREAEAVKLFSNTYLAMRVAFFNELDTFSEFNNFSSKNIIAGVCSDPRIGNYYNNPSFGYGGYCLPKDTKQMLDSFEGIPHDLIKAIIDSNKTRKKFIVKSILSKKVATVGIFRLIMKEGSDNFRESAIIDIIKQIQIINKRIIIYEPLVKKDYFENIKIINEISEFKFQSDLIIANRSASELNDVKEKVYTRDIFNEN